MKNHTMNMQRLLSLVVVAAVFAASCGTGKAGPEISDAHLRGELIAFSSDRDGDWEIFSMAPDGSNVRQVTQNMSYDWAPSWSPDGQRLSFTSDYLDGEISVLREEIDGAFVDTTIEISGDREIYIINADGTGRTRITDNETITDGNPSWSPDGETIAFHSDAAGFDATDIYLVSVDGSDVRALTALGGVNWDPDWSPDGNKISFSSLLSEWLIYTTNADGTGLTFLEAAGSGWKPSWAPSGDQIAYASNRNGNWDIYLSDDTGDNSRQLTTSSADENEPVWSPSGDRIAFSSNFRGRPEILIIDIESGQIHQTGQVGFPSDWTKVQRD